MGYTQLARVVISGDSSDKLASDITKELGARSVGVDLKEFTDYEIRPILEENVAGHEAIIIAPASGNPNTVEKQTRLLMRAAKKARAARVTLVIPYMTYGRSDSTFGRRSAVGLIDTIETYKPLCDQIIVADPHNPLLTQETFEDVELGKNCIIAEFGYLYGKQLSSLFDDGIISRQNLMLTYPDVGASKRISETFREALYSSATIDLDPSESDEWNQISASRNRKTEEKRFSFTEDVNGKDIVIFEDMIASGGTACEVARVLKENGARSVTLFATSALFTPKDKISPADTVAKIERLLNSVETSPEEAVKKLADTKKFIREQRDSAVSVINRINNSDLDAVFVTDTYDHQETAPEIAKAIEESPIIHTIKTGPMLAAMVEALHKKATTDMHIDDNSMSAILTGKHHTQQGGGFLYRKTELKPGSPLLKLSA